MSIEENIKYLADIKKEIEEIPYEEKELLKDKERILIRFLDKRISDPHYFIREIKKIKYTPMALRFDEPRSTFISSWERGKRSLIGVVEAVIEDLKEDLKFEERSEDSKTLTQIEESNNNKNPNKKVFIIHGHDEALKYEVARFISQIDLEPIILHEQLDSGDTVIEKFEREAKEANFAIALFTEDDDLGSEKRARQNVVLEYGFFLGSLGRSRAMVLKKGDVEIPSDINGLLYTNYNGEWKLKLASALKSVGYDVDMNKIVKL